MENETTYCECLESAAEWLAKRGYVGKETDPLPNMLCVNCVKYIADNIEDFQRRIKDYAYANAMNKLDLPEDMD